MTASITSAGTAISYYGTGAPRGYSGPENISCPVGAGWFILRRLIKDKRLIDRPGSGWIRHMAMRERQFLYLCQE